jgi:hypothetical protein
VYNAPTGTPPNVPPLTLANMEAAVTAAAANGGGWVQITFHEVCSQQFDPGNYSFCISDWGPVELSTLNAFLDWLGTTGQPGGAPPRTDVQTVSQVINGPDTLAPITSVNCDGSPCASTVYNGSTTVSLASKDPGGSGVQATYYTTDGSTPTTTSPVWNGQPFTINQATTFKFFSVDNSGNTEAVQTQQVQVQPNADPVIGSAGDVACDPTAPAYNNGLGVSPDCVASHTVGLLTGVDAVLPLGDDQYECGGLGAFEQSYGPTWGVKKSITYPVPGDKDWATSGGTDCPATPGAGYQQYFGGSGGLLGSPVPAVVNTDPSTAYYSYNLGNWHVIALNTAPCVLNDPGFCAAGSTQDLWLQNDLAHDTASCTLAYYQNPRWASAASGSGGDNTMQQLWQDLYNGNADVVLNGDSHWYERFAPMNASGVVDNAKGVREFIVGTGGAALDTPGAEVPTSQVLDATTHGVIKMTLHNGNYAWQFVNDGESAFTDSGTGSCHGRPDNAAPTTTISVNGQAPSAGFYNAPVTVSLAATDNTGGSGVDKTYYTTDGSTPTTASTVYTTPFTVSATATVKFFTTDKAGNAEAVKSQSIQIDTVAPATTVRCNGAACSTGWYRTTPVTITLTATDNTGGSGVRATSYTTDGTDPRTSSTAKVYAGPFTVSQTTTVRYYSSDVAGNLEATKSQLIRIDAAAPTVSVTAPASGSSFTRGTRVTVTASAADTGTGTGAASGIASVTFFLDGTTQLATDTTSPYTFSWNTSNVTRATHRLTAVATDAAGNTTTSASITVTIR